MTDERVEAYAEIAVRIGANVQPGQEVFLNSLVEHAQVTRALARQAYRAGASYVNALYYDMTPFQHRAMLEHGPEEALTHTPPWLRKYVESYDGNALLATIGDPDPALSAGLDEGRVGRAHMAELLAIRQRQHRANSVNWCGVGAPSLGSASPIRCRRGGSTSTGSTRAPRR